MRTFILSLCLAIGAVSCSDDSTSANNGSADAGLDQQTNMDVGVVEDSGQDARLDMIADLGGDIGTTPTDAGNDSGADVGNDSGPDMGATACTKEPNGGSPPATTCQHGGADWLAWQWVVAEDMTVSEIQMHTSEGFAAIFADDNTRPGTVLVEGALSDADADGWRTLTVEPPLMITAGTYWLGEDVLTCSTVQDGTEFTYFAADSTAGPWSGPFMAHPFTARISGTCP